MVTEVRNGVTCAVESTPDAPHVRSLWKMSKEKRIQVWKELQPQMQLHELELGGDREWDGVKCPVDGEELAVLCPQGSLEELQQLVLQDTTRVTDDGFCVLVSAGCGVQLTSLLLSGE